ncbi:hypothetical protein ES332_A03G098200v1 [Gossypium tomentosum]|uniref:Uncharacterized protein n=1 Tax=Gossypium tomentosum TaxID=34277 RepID=A0A5D2R7P9_GOSTO|nr:hypothetical protein ES332_A03G098200v1 [Gossypium tomentosum]
MIEENNDKSLCEKSMKMVMNIIRFSSFSIVKASLGTTGYHSTPTKNLKPATDFDMNGNVNGMFTAYIMKVHKKNRSNFHEASTHSPYILPPLPIPLSRNQ